MIQARDSRVLQIAIMLIASGLAGLPAHAKYGGGAGEPNDPYLIRTAEQMNAIGADANDWGKHFKLMADIDLTSLGGNSFRIIGTDSNTPFRGVFDGDGHTISGFVYTSPVRGDVGLFGTVADPNAEIRNLRLIAPRIDISAGVNTGSLVGYLREGNIINCHAENADVHGHWENVGGLVGQSGLKQANHEAYVTIRDCSCTGRVSAEFSTAGGLVGNSMYGLFDRCLAACEVTGKDKVGGLVGTAGFPGSSIFINCYSVGNVTGDECVGGLLGYWGMGTITNCYSVGRITGTGSVRGFVGAPNYAAIRVKASFWHAEITVSPNEARPTGWTTAEMQDPNTFMAAGWDFVGKSDGPGDIWAEPAGGGYPILWWQLSDPPKLPFSSGTGTPDDPYLIATAEQLNSIGHNPRLMGAHLRVIDDIDLSGVRFYPIGSNEYAFEGVFDGGNFAISNFTYVDLEPHDIGLFGIITGGAAEVRNVRLVNPMVGGAETKNVGSLVGRLLQGTLRNCHVEGGRISGKGFVGGLVGQTGMEMITGGNILARVMNCGTNTVVAGQGIVGGLVGMNAYLAMVSDCHADGNVSGQTNVGGLVGVSFVSETIVNSRSSGTVVGKQSVGGLVGSSGLSDIRCSFSTADVQGDTQVGGLVGLSYGTITDCYAIAIVTGKSKIGGLVGQNGSIFPDSSNPGTISNCYSAGHVSGTQSVGGLVGYNEVGATTASFWDRETSGLRTMSGRTTSQMHTASTFLSAGWDFVDETQNGTEDIWRILEGQDYPRLSWEQDKQP